MIVIIERVFMIVTMMMIIIQIIMKRKITIILRLSKIIMITIMTKIFITVKINDNCSRDDNPNINWNDSLSVNIKQWYFLSFTLVIYICTSLSYSLQPCCHPRKSLSSLLFCLHLLFLSIYLLYPNEHVSFSTSLRPSLNLEDVRRRTKYVRPNLVFNIQVFFIMRSMSCLPLSAGVTDRQKDTQTHRRTQ